MRQFIKTVTLTGADDSVEPSELAALSEEFPFVEWGILLSKHSAGKTRFPSEDWLWALFEETSYERAEAMQLSAHICGRWVWDLCGGKLSLFEDEHSQNQRTILGMFNRMQLNFHSYLHKVDPFPFIRALSFLEGVYSGLGRRLQFIFQLDSVNNNILGIARGSGLDAVGLFDLSDGAGVLPEQWPEATVYTGYAGGLSPENLFAQIHQIGGLVTANVWIDAESHVRSDDNQQFDLKKVRAFLEVAQPYVITEESV